MKERDDLYHSDVQIIKAKVNDFLIGACSGKSKGIASRGIHRVKPAVKTP